MQMPRQTPAPYPDDHGWLITPRALTSVATVVGLVYTLHAPVRYVLHLGESIDLLDSRVAALETELDHQRSTIAAAAVVLESRANDRETPRSDPQPQPAARAELPRSRQPHRAR